MLDQITVFQKFETGQQNIDEQTMQQIRAFVWDQLVREKLLLEETNKIGLTVSKEELSDQLIGNNIHPMIQQRRFFADESGRFNRTLLLQFLNFKDDEPTDYQMQETLNDYKKLWIFLERTVKFSILQEKYNILISNAIGVNSLQAKSNFDLNSKHFDVQYLVKPYYSIPDAEFSVSDKEVKNRYNDQINRYRQDPNVSINYVSFNIQPQQEDFEETERFINNLKDEFAKTDDVAEVVNMNSDIQYTGRNYSTTTVPAHYKDFAFSGKKGDVTEPAFINNTYSMARIMETGISMPDSVKLRHIFLLSAQESKSDSIIKAIRSGANFGELAKKYSAVKQTANNNGEIGWIVDGDQALDKEIMQNAFAKATNEVFTYKNAQGVQIIQIMEKTAPKKKVKLAILERSVIASSKTQSKIFNEAKRFAAGLKAAEFDTLARKNNYIVRQANDIYQYNDNVQNIPHSRSIVRWVFDNSKGTVSDVFECDNELIVAVITDVNKSKYRSVEKVVNQIRSEIIRDKKAEKIIADFNEKIKTNDNLSAIAENMQLELKSAENVNFSSYQFGSEGFEPAIIGKVVALTDNKLSNPVKGNSGVFVVQMINESRDNVDIDIAHEKLSLSSRLKYSLPNMILMDMRNKAEIKDNRLNFY